MNLAHSNWSKRLDRSAIEPIYLEMIQAAENGDALAAHDTAFCYLEGTNGFPEDNLKGEHYLKLFIEYFDRSQFDDGYLIYSYILLACIVSNGGRHGLARKYFAKAYDLAHSYFYLEQANKVLDKHNFFWLLDEGGYDLDEIRSLRNSI